VSTDRLLERGLEGVVTLPGVGASLGDYRIVARLGAGGMGQVFSARHRDGEELVALKQLTLADPTLLYRFKQEFRLLADLSHPNLVRLGELVVLPGGLAFFTMELIEGQPLVRWVRRRTPAGTLPNIHRLCHALRQLAAGVLCLHRASRVHRDLKPSNVLVTAEGRVAILDFGLACEPAALDARITATGQLIGTPAYMAPEQGGRNAGPAVDLYAIGVILFECLTGCLPFVGAPVRVLVNKQQQPAPDPRELSEGIPAWLAQLCRLLLDLEPARRLPAERIIAVLDEHLESAPSPEALATRGPELVGRERELELLEDALEQVTLEGRATVVRISGPPGRGKSALIDRFAQTVHEDEGVVIRGRCHPRESVPYKGVDSLVDALAVYLRALPAVDLAALRPRHVPELCELFPVLAGVWPETGRRVIAREPVERRRLGVAALREVFARIGDSFALLVVIDDAHWGDLDGLGVLGELLLPPDPPALLAILAYDPEAAGAVVEPLRHGGVLEGAAEVELELAPLDEQALRTMARALLEAAGVEQSEARAEQLVRASAGEPRAVVRAAALREPTAVAAIDDGEWLRTIRAIEPAAARLLQLAALAGEPLAFELALAIHGGDAADFEVLARELVGAGLLGPEALETPALIKLAHARVGELVRVELDERRAVELHRALAQALATRGAAPEVIAEHYARGGDYEQARIWVTRAAHGAAETLAFARAERLYRRALAQVERTPRGAHKDERHELELALAEQLSHLARAFEAAELFRELADELPPEQASRLRLRAAGQYAVSGWHQLAIPLLRELMREAGERFPSTTLTAILTFSWNRLRLALFGRRGRLREVDGIPPRLLERYDLVFAATMALGRSEILLTIALRPRLLELAISIAEPTRLVAALMSESSLLATTGRFDRAEAVLAEIREIVEQVDDPLIRAYFHAAEHFVQTRLSLRAEAEASFERAMHELERCPGESWVLVSLFHAHTVLLRQLGAYGRLRRLLPGWISVLHGHGQRQHETLLLGEEVMIRAQLGDCEYARRSLERARAGWEVDLYTFVDYLLGLSEIWLLMAEGRASEAYALALTTERELRRHKLTRFQLMRVRMSETRCHAELVHALASTDPEALPSRRRLRRLRRSGLPKFAAGALLLSAGRASLLGDVARERRRWREALDEFDQLSMCGVAAAVRWRLVELGVEGHEGLAAEARAYFAREKIEDISRFVDLMAPAYRRGLRRADPGLGERRD
jgi:hypothetical protein